ncbi:MAG: helix-turn-helix transcriptional regulator [Vitreimonas sp.]
MRNRRTIALPPSGGRVLRQVSTSQFRFTLGAYAPWSALPSHVHEEHLGVVFVASGCVEETYAAESLMGAQGALMLKMHDLRHTNRFGPQGATLLIVEQLQPAPLLKPLPMRPALNEASFVRMVGGHLAQELAEGREVCEIGLTSYAVDLWGVAATRRGTGRSGKVARAAQLIHDDIGSVRRIDDLARNVEAHPVYLARGFRAQFGQSLQAYVLRVRLGRAAELVLRTHRKLAEIAADVGFADQAHMTRAFRRYYGRTPRSFRAEAQV